MKTLKQIIKEKALYNDEIIECVKEWLQQKRDKIKKDEELSGDWLGSEIIDELLEELKQ